MTEKIFRFRWLIIVVMVLAFVSKTVQAQPTVTPETPNLVNGYYQIENEKHLYWFAEQVNNGNVRICAVLTADITVNTNVLDADGNLNSGNTDFYEWTPIGDSSHHYFGTFDGKGHTISGLYFNGENKINVGLFGVLDASGIIRNVGVIDSYIKGNNNVGGVCGENFGGIIENCYNTGTVSGNSYIGGVCGHNIGNIKNCYNAGFVSGTEVGGVCGDNVFFCIIENCYNTGQVSGIENNSVNIGGVCGESGGIVTNCYNMGEIGYDENNANVGGVCGYKFGGTITNCYYLNDENDSPKGIGDSSSDATENKIEGKSLTEFANGSVAWLLNGNSLENNNTTGESDWNWYQALGTDKGPVLKKTGNNTVYVAKKCTTGEIYEWSNSKTTVELTDHVFANKILSKKSDTGTDNLYSYVCENCHIAQSTKIKIIKNLTKDADDDITIERDDEKAPWKTKAKITLGDDPTTNWYNAPVEFTTTGGVSYTRTMSDKNRWATICLPYAVSTENENCKFYELSGVETDKITLAEITVTSEPTIAAGRPVFVKANEGVENITFSTTGETETTMVTAPTAGCTIEGYTLTGVFNLTELSKVEENVGGDLFIKNDNMWNMSQPANNMKVKIFHAYLKNNGSGTYAPKRSLTVDGEATAISDALDTLNDTNAEYYDMSGRRINALQKGVNIIRSGNKTRKVIIK